jgi:hypothetical protein
MQKQIGQTAFNKNDPALASINELIILSGEKACLKP